MTMRWTATTTVVTGASSGIGVEFARRVAAAGGNVVLVARRLDRLEALAQELRNRDRVEVIAMQADLAAPAEVAALVDRLSEVQVDGLVNAAGFGTYGPFVEQDGSRTEREIAVNVTAVVMLTQAWLPGMVARGSGVVVNVASTAAFQPVPNMAVYGASKAFVLSFTEALWGETEGTGVRVLALAPGGTRTEFFDVAGEQAMVGQPMPVEEVVSEAWAALDRPAQLMVMPGADNRFRATMSRVLPRRAVVRASRRLMSAPQSGR